jgi:uncharacterized protein
MAAGKTRPACQLYARAGRTGLAKAEYRVGRCYLDGVGVPPSRAKGIRWLERAAHHGHVEAQSQLAVIYLHGTAGEPDPKNAASLFDVSDIADPDYVMAMRQARMAAEAGSGEAQAVLAFILSSGPQDMRDLDEADLWYERSAAAGCPQGMLGHALALNRKGGGETVQREVAVQLGKAAEAGLPAALYLLGVMSERGLGVTRNESAAAEFYRRAAEKGHRAGQAHWGNALMRGIGVDANPSDGETWLRRAALAGDPEAAAAISMRPAESCRQIMRKQQVGSAAQPRPATRARRARSACSILPVPASRTIPSRACSGSASPLLGGRAGAPSSAISCSPASGKRTIVSVSTKGSSRRRYRVIR